MHQNICFIGAGNMATSLIGGLISTGHQPTSIIACDPNEEQRTALENRFSVQTSADSPTAVSTADVVVLAVKPQIMKTVCTSLAPALQEHNPLLMSVAAGIRCADIDSWLGSNRAIVRCMPNTPALYGHGASGLYATSNVTDEQKNIATYIASTAGIVEWVDHEKKIDAVTALSGSGPAYGFLLIEAMQASAIELGLEPQVARRLATQTLLGAAVMARDDERDASELRRAVTSKGGTTAAALNIFEQGQFSQLVADAMQAASDRADQLANENGDA